MGAASSSDAPAPPEELSTRLSSWLSEGGEAALAALETAAPALSAALRAADAEAVTSALGGVGGVTSALDGGVAVTSGAAADADADRPESVEGEGDGVAANNSPAPKRARAPLVPFTKSILLHQDNTSKVLGYAGYRTVFTLEALCARARPALKGAKLILDVSTESSLTTAARTQNRHELLDARRTGSLPTDTPLRIVLKSTETGAQRRTADVLYKDNRVLFPSPRPRQLFRAASTDPGDRDVERSRASLEAYERERAANLALGCIIVDADSRAGDHAGDITKRAFFRTAVQSSSEEPEAADEATAAALVEAMGGAHMIPRRLVLAAGRVHDHPVSSQYGSRLHLERAFQYSMDKSVVLDSLDVARRLSWFAVKALLTNGGRTRTISEAVFREKVCEAAGLSATDSAVVWREAMGGSVPPFTPSYVDPLTPHHERREVGDVRPGDVAVLEVIGWLWPALAAFALAASAQGDPAKCFAADEPCIVAVKTFEDIVIRQEIIGSKENGSEWSMPLAVLDDLAYRRDGEDDAPGQARVAAAVASLLTPERVPTLAVGAQVEYGEGDSTTPRNDPVAWVTASVTEVNASTGIATIRTEGANETKTVGLGALRQGPYAAAVVLAHAIADHRNDIVLQIVTSPLMALSPLSFVVGAPGKPPIGVGDTYRATALDHAIASRNIVAIGLLTKNYVCSWKRWEAVLSTCHSLDEADSGPSAKEGSLVDLSCALRKAPGVFFNSFNAFKAFEEGGGLENLIERLNIPDTPGARLALQCVIVARDGDAARARALFEDLKEKCNAAGTPGTADSILNGMLTWAAKTGSAAVIDSLLAHHNHPGIELDGAVRIAIADGHIHCLESLLVVGPSLTKFLGNFSPGAPASTAPLRIILEAVQMDDGAALDLMRSRGVRLGPFEGTHQSLQPIDAAARRGSPSAVQAILRDPSVVQWIMARKSDAIMRACDRGHPESLAALLERVQLIHTKENSEVFGSSSPLLQAVASRSLATVEIVLAHGVDVNEKIEGRRSALACAAGLHAIDIATELLKRGASVGSPSDLTQTALTYALNNSENIEDASLRNSMVQLLLRHDANLAEHFLYWVKKNWLTEGQVQAFLDAGANPSVSDSNGITPLHINVFHAKVLTEAANAQHDILENITTLVLAGADLTAKTTADTSDEEAEWPLFEHVLPGGLTPMQVAETIGYPLFRDKVVAHLTAAIALRAL